jgi:hypothetical protein
MSIKCNNTIDKATNCSNFIFFGCWNNINCKSEYIYRNIILDYISKNEKDIKQIYIAGDNWYTNKKKINEDEFKLYFTEVLRTGYDKLYRMNKDIYIAVGNHDIDTDIKDKDNDKSSKTSNANQVMSLVEDNLKKNCNINTQKYYLQKIKNAVDANNYDEIRIPTLEELRDMNNELTEANLCEKGIYIYIDNIGVRYNNNNIIIIINTNLFEDLNTGTAYLEDIKRVIKEVDEARGKKSNKEQIFVMGHIPLFTYKKDIITIHDINKKKKGYRKIIIELYNILVQFNIIYLCADTHNFSIMKIRHNDKVLIQITAGTGGADPDLIKGNYAITPIKSTIQIIIDKEDEKLFEITAYALNSYGYVSIDIYKTYIDVLYKQIITDKNELAPSSYVMKMRSLSAPNNNINRELSDKANILRKGSLSTSRASTQINKKQGKINKLNYKIIRDGIDGMDIKYINKIIEKNNFINNPIYKNKIICKNIKTNPKGYITDLANNLFCYKKNVKK